MSKRRDDGGRACPVSVQPNFQFVNEGMSLRDWFAGQALAGFMQGSSGYFDEEMAAQVYRIADRMIAERAKGGTQ